MKALIVGTQRDQVTKAQWDMFFFYRRQLKQQLGLEIETHLAETFPQIAEVCQKYQSEIVFIIPFWQESAMVAQNAIAPIKKANPQRKLIFIDPWAQTSSRYFNLLPYVDILLKRQCYRNLENHQEKFLGGTMFTDFLAKERNYDLAGWDVSSEVPTSYLNRITSGWNLGTTKKFRKQLEKPQFFDIFKPEKTIDVFCRLSLGKSDDWYSRYRRESVAALKPLEADYRVAVSGKNQDQLVSSRQYYQELQRSKIVFSPFGWGENCWRDFEAICHNCLLVKPSMSHIYTEPNIFIEGKTYVPVRWDYADLEDKIKYYLQHWEEATYIIENARQLYQAYFQEERFIKTIKQIIA